MKKQNDEIISLFDFSICKEKEVKGILSDTSKKIKLIFTKSFKKYLKQNTTLESIKLFKFRSLKFISQSERNDFLYYNN